MFIWSRYFTRTWRDSLGRSNLFFLDKISHVNIGGWQVLRGRLDWEELENQIYRKFVECLKSNIQTCLVCITLTVAALTKLFNPVLVPTREIIQHLTLKT